MVDMKERLKIMHRLGEYYIPIWDECDPHVAQAIEAFRERWKPYSLASRRYPILRLLEELIDPAVIQFSKQLPEQYAGHTVPGGYENLPFSECARKLGFDDLVRFQKECLRKLLRFTNGKSADDRRIIATLESLIELAWSCAGKRPRKTRPAIDGVNLNARRKLGFCRFCGNLTEFSTFIQSHQDAKGAVVIEIDKLRLSHQYCTEHRPKLISGEWNPAYKQAERSYSQFELELARLYKQCAKRAFPQVGSGNVLVDEYIHHYFLFNTLLGPADHAELRTLARKMVDFGLSDRKKEILALISQGLNQSDVAKRLGVSRQSVSKALGTIPVIFHLEKQKKRAPKKSRQPNRPIK